MSLDEKGGKKNRDGRELKASRGKGKWLERERKREIERRGEG